jgi:hypothetical protein
MNKKSPIQQFRDAVYQKMLKRADAGLDLLDALTTAGHVESPVALSEEVPFRRKFSMVYDTLDNGEIDAAALADMLCQFQPGDSQTLAGFEVYATDTTFNERPQAETLPEREWLRHSKDEAAQAGWKFVWLVRLVERGTSWVAPQDVQRVPRDSTPNQMAGNQVKALDRRSPAPKVVTADSGFFNQVFLSVFLAVRTVVALVRMRHNISLYERPQPKPKGTKGPARKHGPKFKLSNPPREPDRTETFELGKLTVKLAAWHSLHMRQLPKLEGLALRVVFLKADGTPRYRLPLWVFWTGPLNVPLHDLCLMYLWRFAIEHAFRFMKQHLGLNANQSTYPASVLLWMRWCALAYWQLLLMRYEVEDVRPAWNPQPTASASHSLTPGQVQRAALRFLLRLGTPAAAPRAAGKGIGRAKGYHPAPRPRYAVVRKSKKRPQIAQNTLARVV